MPRSSWELAVINQFYTPAWIVKALVDNTLGRLWLQMHPDSSLRATEPPPLPGEPGRDAPVADYLVRRTGEKIRFQRLTETGEVQTFKPASDVALIDPACGTMHFGQYSFGLFHRMYLDEIEHAGQDGWPAEPSVAEPSAIPAAIIENNLFGVDIDPRAIQIASLSLLLTAREAALRHGFSPRDVQVKRTNLVVANAVDLGEDRLRALVERLGSGSGSATLRTRLFETLWDNLRHVGELGSLVQVHEGVTRVLDDWIDAEARSRGITRILQPAHEQQLELGDIATQAARARAEQLELERKAIEGEAARLGRELLAAVEAAAASTADEPADRLFAEDTARGLKLVQLLSRRYDVAVMNPPYGRFVPRVREFVKSAYPLTSNNIYATFIDRACHLTEPDGLRGSARAVHLHAAEELREAPYGDPAQAQPPHPDARSRFRDSRRRDRGNRRHHGPGRNAVSRSRLRWRWEERDFGFRFRAGPGPNAAEHYQATAPGDYYVVPASQRKLSMARADTLAKLAKPPTAPRVVPNPWTDYDRHWDWITGPDGILLNYAGCLEPEEIRRREDEGVARVHELVIDLLARPEPAPLTVPQVQQMHRALLGEIYPFAGAWRTVALHKGEGPTKWPLPPGGIRPQMELLERDVFQGRR